MLCADRRGVAFEASDLKKADDGYTLTVEIFDFDHYQIDDILNLKVGDSIQVKEEEGEEGKYYRVLLMSDYYYTYSVGETELILSVMPIQRSQ